MLLDPNKEFEDSSLKKGALPDEIYRERRPQGTKTQEEEGTE